MAYQWVSADMRTGRVLADLPDLSVDRVGVVLGSYTSALASLPVPTAPEGWERATLQGAAVMVLLDDSVSGDPVPVWGGFVNVRDRGERDVVSLSLATVEAYLDRRYVGDKTYTATDQNVIVSDLVASYVADTLPIRVQVVGAAGVARDRTYKDAGDKSVLSVLSELAGVEGGPEWTVGWEWQHSPERLTPVLYVGSRLGSEPGVGFAPAATFEMPGAVTRVNLREDFSSGRGATDVMAVSSPSADVRPQSPRQVSSSTERPTFEHRFTPSTSITSISTLTAHARAALARMAQGARSLSLSAVVDDAPRLGVDWWVGDTVGYVIGGFDSAGVDTVPAFPGGISGTARAIGWELTIPAAGVVGTVEPILTMED